MTLPDMLAHAPWMAALVVTPLAAATLAFALGGRAAARVGLAASAVTAAAVCGLAWQVWHLGAQRYAVGGWGAPLGIDLVADGLSVVMVLMAAVVGVPVSIYARDYFGTGRVHGRSNSSASAHGNFWVLWLFLWASMNALFLSADLFNLYVALELITLSAVALVSIEGGGVAVGAALRYLLAALAGSLLYLMAVALLYWTAGTLDLYLLRERVTAGGVPGLALALAAIGLFVKSALFPLHFWLPAAHANAPAPVSALLSALVVKASYYLLLRLWVDTFGDVVSREAALLVGILGAAAIVWGSLQAMLAERLKLLVAYSTVAQLGYLFLVFPLILTGDGPGAWEGGALYALSHACAKAALFLAAGAILYAAGHDRLDGLAGLASRLPMPVMTIGLTGVALMGLPPGGTFVAKWLVLDAALESPHSWAAAIVVGGGLLAAGYIFRVIAPAMASPPADAPPLRHVPAAMRWSALVLAVVAVLLGAATTPALQLLEIRAPAVGRIVETIR
jgi:multicomponent Na+:H+ antiporter subunit D